LYYCPNKPLFKAILYNLELIERLVFLS
jgi:hypothetical protein